MSIKVVGPEDLTESHTTPICEPGQLYHDADSGMTYQYVKNAGADAIAADDVVGVYNSSGTTRGSVSVTAATMLDITDGTTTRSLAAGIGLGAIASGSYGWIAVQGRITSGITTDGNVAAGHPLILADGAKVATPASTAASAHHGVFGYAHEADTSTTLGVAYINCAGA